MVVMIRQTPYQFQSTLSVRRATDLRGVELLRLQISIHALRKESDARHHHPERSVDRFQSTLSVRRATTAFTARKRKMSYFNPRSP